MLRVDGHHLRTLLVRPTGARGLILLANAEPERSHVIDGVAEHVQHEGFATLIVDLLDDIERVIETSDPVVRFDVARLSQRAIGAIDWVEHGGAGAALPIGTFGVGIGAGALLVAAAHRPHAVHAVISCGGRTDLAAPSLAHVHAPVLLLVGAADTTTLELNRTALGQMTRGSLSIVGGKAAGFEDRVARLASSWLMPLFPRPVGAGSRRSPTG